MKIKPLPDLQVTGVTLNFIEPVTMPSITLFSLAKDQAGPDPDGIGALIATLQLEGGVVFDAAATLFQYGQPVPTGLAAYLYSVFGKLQYDGTVTVSRDEVWAAGELWGTSLSNTLNVAGLRAEWATMKAIIQRQQDDVFSGKTTYTVGAPNQLTAANLLALIQARANFNSISALGASRATGSTGNNQGGTPYSGPVASTGDTDGSADGNTDPLQDPLPSGPYRNLDPTLVFKQGRSVGGIAKNSVVSNPSDPYHPYVPFPRAAMAYQGLQARASYQLGNGQNGLNQWSQTWDCEGYYSIVSYDLGPFGVGARDLVMLVGTQTVTNGTGNDANANTTTQPASKQLCVGPGAGSFIINYPAGTPPSGTMYSPNAQFAKGSGIVTYTEVRVYPGGAS